MLVSNAVQPPAWTRPTLIFIGITPSDAVNGQGPNFAKLSQRTDNAFVICRLSRRVYKNRVIVVESTGLRSVLHLLLILGILFSSVRGSHAGSMKGKDQSSLPTSEHAHGMAEKTYSHSLLGENGANCLSSNSATAEMDHVADCCIAACNSFGVPKSGFSLASRLRVPVISSWTVSAADGMQPEGLYRPPEA